MAPLQEILLPDYLQESNILNLLPAAVYVCDKSGVIKRYNEQAVKLWGRQPVIGEKHELFNGAFKLYLPNGTFLPHDQAPVASCLRDGEPRRDVELIVERPDHSCINVRVNAVPVKDDKGQQVGVISCFFDITEQRKGEKELERKTLELQDYVDNAAIGLHWVNSDGIIVWANKAELDMLGYTKEEYIGHHISEFHVQQDKISDILNRLTCNETLDQYESELLCKDGSVKSVQISSNVLWEEGKFVHTRCFTVDVTEQKKLFLALKESEERQRRLLKSLPVGIYTCDENGYINFYNDAAAKLWGREPQLGKDRWCGAWKIEKTDGSPMSLDTCPMAECLQEGRAVFGEEVIIIRPDSGRRHILPHPQPFFDASGKITGAINMLMDITDLKEVENALRRSEMKYRELAATLERKVEEKVSDLSRKNEELRKSEERYHKMIDEVEDYAIILLDKEGIVQNWNKGAEKIKGYKESEIVGKSFSTFYLPEDQARELPKHLIEEATEKGKADYEGWRLRKDGTTFWGSIVLTALHNNQNNVIGFSKVTRDLTRKKLADDKLRDYTNQLKFQNEQLEQFAYAASHDMKEPLRKILFYNNYLWETAGLNLKDKEREYLNRSINAARRMQVLIDDLLAYSKASSDRQDYASVDLNEVMDDILKSYKDDIEEKKATIHVSFLPIVKGTAFQLRQMFDNLVSNALKYHHPERKPEIQINAEKTTGEDIQGLVQNEEYYKICISDNGIGFSPEFSEKIFELFQRLSGSTKLSGTGVGLALCRKIAQNHHGAIKAEGHINEGANFCVYLPVQ
jgi:PAS domain S-box-containing protein